MMTQSQMRYIKIFDTSLRDGEQSPGCSMNLSQKIQLADQLEHLGVDVIEAGFAASSKGDFEAVCAIAKRIKNAEITTLARALKGDIDIAYEALKYASKPRLHTFIATSEIHMTYKLKKSPEAVILQAVESVKYAKKLLSNIEFSAEDATRSDPIFLARVIDKVIEAGATTINIPDTVGYTTPDEYAAFILKLLERSKHLHKVDLSVHCHDDLGMAVANSLSAIRAGATQVECTINGIGERAGNAALEEIVMALKTRSSHYGCDTGIITKELAKTSQLVTTITGMHVQANKAIVGANAFAHESGIHQHGMLQKRETYEIMTPESVGYFSSKLILGKHSGKHGFTKRLQELGFNMTEESIDDLFVSFKQLADEQNHIQDDDLKTLVKNHVCIASHDRMMDSKDQQMAPQIDLIAPIKTINTRRL
jgi:2-isopropylmalate synthase